jgi:hypothetical protein
VLQLVLDPVSDHLPAPQCSHPSVVVVAAVLVDFCPAGHSWTVHMVLTPAIENLPNSQFVQPFELEFAADRVDYCPAGHSWS